MWLKYKKRAPEPSLNAPIRPRLDNDTVTEGCGEQAGHDLELILAPIQGATDDLFRSTFGDHFDGVDYAVAPFISTSSGDQIRPNAFSGLLPENNQTMRVIPQLMGNNPDHFILFVRHLESLGYKSVNWNLGCPFPVVVNKKKGAGLLPHVGQINSLLDRVLSTVSIELSVKLRLGLDSKTDILDVLSVLNQYPISQIVIHPRTGRQMYKGRVDLDVFERCLELSEHPLVYNGDILDAAEYRVLKKRFASVNCWMIGRGLIRNPFLAELIRGCGTTPYEMQKRFQRFHWDLYNRYSERLSGPSHLLNRMKELWSYFEGSFKDGHKVLKKIQKCRHQAQFEQVLTDFFKSDQRAHNP